MDKDVYGFYSKDERGRYVIDMKITDLDELFNGYDPAPIHKRDLSRHAVNHILDELIIFPSDAKVVLLISMPKTYSKYQQEIRTAINAFFRFKYHSSDLHLRRRFKKGLSIFFAGSMMFVISVALSTYMRSLPNISWWMNILAEGLAVGGWVSLWQPIQTLLYDWYPLYKERGIYKKILNMEISFRYF